jgi:hypothetical protein
LGFATREFSTTVEKVVEKPEQFRTDQLELHVFIGIFSGEDLKKPVRWPFARV